jgi:hypothetical protein
VKCYFNLTDDSQDPKIERLIKYATDTVQKLTGRVFASERVRESVRGYGRTFLTLSRFPVSEVHSVTQNGEIILDYSIHSQDSGLLYRADGWQWTIGRWFGATCDPAPGTEAPEFIVEYTAGYIMPDETERNFPYDLEQAVFEMISDKLTNTDPNVSSIKVGDYSVSYRDSSGSGALSSSVQAVIDRYRLS